jgi:hypothetical protein
MDNNPVQVILNAENYVTDRTRQAGGGHKDFYAGHDKEFVRHRDALATQIGGIRKALIESSADLGYAKVKLRKDAWAKSYRPVQSLFTDDRTPTVGGGSLGEMVVEINPAALEVVGSIVRSAEASTRTKVSKKSGLEYIAPSLQRSEVGAVERIELYGPSDKRRFSAQDGLKWLQNPRTGGYYEVDLFELPRSSSDLVRLPLRKSKALQSLEFGLRAIPAHIRVERLDENNPRSRRIAVRVEEGQSDERDIQLYGKSSAKAHNMSVDVKKHLAVLSVLDAQPIVKSISLPPLIERTAGAVQPRARPSASATIPRTDNVSYPIVGVIDGGLAKCLDPWVVRRHGLLATADRDEAHGTFIGGILVAAQANNGAELRAEDDGCNLVDVDIYPTEADPTIFPQYYPRGLDDFLDELRVAALDLRQRLNVRVFNLSLNATTLASLKKYSTFAERLDRIADETDSIFVISAGNLNGDARREWPSDDVAALRELAGAQNDTILSPAESIRNISVAAINPPGLMNSVPHAPANYSRRGPGLQVGIKPDLAHYGGSGTRCPNLGTGLYSVDPTSAIVDGCGTSFAAPMIAKILASLDAKIQGTVSRETLIALPIHFAKILPPLSNDAFRGIARHMVGFGRPSPTETILFGADAEITLIFAERLVAEKLLRFAFPWPASLVDPHGKCRGHARLTIVSRPPLDYAFDAEVVRINVDAKLKQEGRDGKFDTKSKQVFVREPSGGAQYESELIRDGLKWSAVKSYELHMPEGQGFSSNWVLEVDYLTRAMEAMPPDGVPFTVVLTITAPDDTPIFAQMRQALQTIGVRMTDVMTAARIAPRIQ